MIMYLKAKLIIKANDEIDNIPDKIPSNEKALKLISVELLSNETKETKEISVLNILLPSSQKKLLIRFVELIRKVQIDRE